MSRNIFDRLRDAVRVVNGTIRLDEMIPMVGFADVKVTRSDGTIEEKTVKNTVTVVGLNRIALCAVHSAGGQFNSVVIGSATAAPALTDSQSSIGEVGRKTSAVLNASAQSREWIFLVATWAGAADGITSVALGSGAISIGANSLATSVVANRVNGLGVTLGNSDFLHLTMRVRVGSHDVAHT
jgi:hypothetical protein